MAQDDTCGPGPLCYLFDVEQTDNGKDYVFLVLVGISIISNIISIAVLRDKHFNTSIFFLIRFLAVIDLIGLSTFVLYRTTGLKTDESIEGARFHVFLASAYTFWNEVDAWLYVALAAARYLIIYKHRLQPLVTIYHCKLIIILVGIFSTLFRYLPHFYSYRFKWNAKKKSVSYARFHLQYLYFNIFNYFMEMCSILLLFVFTTLLIYTLIVKHRKRMRFELATRMLRKRWVQTERVTLVCAMSAIAVTAQRVLYAIVSRYLPWQVNLLQVALDYLVVFTSSMNFFALLLLSPQFRHGLGL